MSRLRKCGRLAAAPYAFHAMSDALTDPVLIVDDEPAMRQRLKRVLATLGHAEALLHTAGDIRVLALFAVADTIKETSRQAVTDLKALGVTPVKIGRAHV